MESIGTAVFWTVQALAVLLFLLGVGAFRVLVQGCFALRRRARAGSPDYSDVLLKSALAPAVTTIAVPPDASLITSCFAPRRRAPPCGRPPTPPVCRRCTHAGAKTPRGRGGLRVPPPRVSALLS